LTIGFALGVVLTVSAKAGPAEPTLAITLRVYNYAQVPEEILSEAEKEVTEIFRKIGVETSWLHVPQSSGGNQLEFDYPRSKALDLRISLASRLMTKPMEKHLGPQDDVLGWSTPTGDKSGHLAYVFYHRVEDFVQARNLHEHKARLLGLAIAHEMGHLLLPVHTHSSRGVMRANWDRQDFRLATRGNLGFTSKQAELIRSEVLRRSRLDLEVP